MAGSKDASKTYSKDFTPKLSSLYNTYSFFPDKIIENQLQLNRI